MHYILANRRVPSLATCAKKGGFPMFVPSLSWQKDRVYIYKWLKKGVFALFSPPNPSLKFSPALGPAEREHQNASLCSSVSSCMS